MLTSLPASRVIAGGTLVAAVLFSLLFVNWQSGRTAAAVTLVYVGATNCAPCDIWQRNEGATFQASPEVRRLDYREVRSSSLFDVLDDKNWPEDLRIYRQAIGRGAGVPLWLVIADDRLVLQGSGLSQWQAAVLPKIKSLLR